MTHCNHLPSNEQPQEPAARPRREGGLLEGPCEGRLHSHTETDQGNSPPQAAVSFSEFSQLYHYDLGDHYRNIKSYSKRDCKVFGAQAMKEAVRIRKLIYRSPPSSVKESINYVLQNNIVSSDELVGLDHLILRRPSDICQARRDHMMTVLWKQEEQRRRSLHLQPQVEEDSLIDLSKCAEQSSLKSTQSAIARATLSFSP